MTIVMLCAYAYYFNRCLLNFLGCRSVLIEVGCCENDYRYEELLMPLDLEHLTRQAA